jgi:hypothetical protein
MLVLPWGRNQDRDARQERDGRHDEVGRAVPAWLLQAVGDAAVGQERDAHVAAPEAQERPAEERRQ